MAGYRDDVMQVCLNGHLITDLLNIMADGKKFCDSCGEKTISECLHCKTPIKGARVSLSGRVISGIIHVPPYCENCGEEFPWTSKRKKIQEAVRNKENDPLLLIKQFCDRFHLMANNSVSGTIIGLHSILMMNTMSMDLLHSPASYFF